MRVALLTDFSFAEMQGGANVTNKQLIDKGISLGHKVDELTPEHFKQLERNKEKFRTVLGTNSPYDLYILTNINNFDIDVIQWVIDTQSYITLNHDYYFCEFRSCDCKRCIQKCTPAKIFKELFANSKLNIFFSPLQLDIHRKFFGEVLRDAIFLPPPMEREKWHSGRPEERTEDVLFAGMIATHKGVHQILDWADATNTTIHFAGKAVSQDAFERIKAKHTHLGEVPHNDMPGLLRKYKRFVINPQMHESFCLSLAEAIASGCKIVKFEKTYKTGMESYNLQAGAILELCYCAADNFWKEVTNAIAIRLANK